MICKVDETSTICRKAFHLASNNLRNIMAKYDQSGRKTMPTPDELAQFFISNKVTEKDMHDILYYFGEANAEFHAYVITSVMFDV